MFTRRFFSSLRLELKSHGSEAGCLRLAHFSVPELKKDQVLLKLSAAAINPADFNVIQGKYPAALPSLPFCLGNEGSFVIEGVGSEVKKFKKGDTVLVLPGRDKSGREEFFGCWTKHAVVSSNILLQLPDGLSIPVAASIKVNPVTALCLLRNIVKLESGDYVIQNGANSHVGQCIIQFCASFGYKTINIINNSTYSAKVKEDLVNFGANYVFTTDEAKNEVKKLLSTIKKPRLGLDILGGSNSFLILKSLQTEGTMITIGNMARKFPEIGVGDLIFENKIFTEKEYKEYISEAAEAASKGILKEPLNVRYYSIEEYDEIFSPRVMDTPSPRKLFRF